MNRMRPALLIAAKDLRVELRTKDILPAVGLFALLVVTVASFAFPTSGPGREGVAAGMLWMAFLFAGLLGMGRSFALESEEACISGLVASPAPSESIFIGKLLSNLAFTLAAEAAILPVFLVLLQLNPGAGLPLLLVASVAGTFGIVVVGTLLSAMAVNTRTREAILPILAIPISVPALIASVQATQAALEGKSIAAAAPWLFLLVGYGAMFLLVALATFPYVLEE